MQAPSGIYLEDDQQCRNQAKITFESSVYNDDNGDIEYIEYDMSKHIKNQNCYLKQQDTKMDHLNQYSQQCIQQMQQLKQMQLNQVNQFFD